MRFLGTLSVLCFVFFPTALLSQEWRLEGDLVLASAYEWRGLRLDPGANLQYSAYGSAAWDRLRLTAGAWSLTDLSSDPSTGLSQRWGAETSPWIEAALGDVRSQLFLGTVGYFLEDPETGSPLRRKDTWEVYVGGRGAFPRLPVLGEAVLFWDMARGGVGYAELAAALQIPLWVGSVVPLGSVFLEGRSGFSLGQTGDGPAAEAGGALSREQGLSHVDVSLRTTLMPVPVGPLSVSFTLASHWIRGLEAETKRIGSRVGGPVDSSRWVWVLGARLLLPRCRPEKELCRDL
jgi:hypothetical protein